MNGLHLASKEGHINVVLELLARAASVDSSTKVNRVSVITLVEWIRAYTTPDSALSQLNQAQIAYDASRLHCRLLYDARLQPNVVIRRSGFDPPQIWN